MREINRVDLENEIYIYQRSDVKNKDRWYAAIKCQGVPRKHLPLGVMAEATAKKLARQELLKAEDHVKRFGKAALLQKNTVGAAYLWFKEHMHPERTDVISAGRYRVIMSAWDNHILKFLGKKTPIDGRLPKHFAKYPDFRRRAKDGRTKEKYRYALATLRNEIGHASQLLKMARLRAGIGDDFGDLKLEIPRQRYTPGKSKSVGIAAKHLDEIMEAFDTESAEIKQKMIDNPKKRGLWDYHLFLHERLRFFFSLAISTGARVNELRQVAHNDFGEDFKTLRIRKSKTRKGTNRVAYIDNSIVDIPTAYDRFMEYCETANAKTKRGLVFKNRNAKPGEYYIRINSDEGKLPVGRIGNTLKRFLRKYDLVMGSEGKVGKYQINFFSTRHHFATAQVVKGVSPFALAMSLGTSQNMVEQTYYDPSEANTIAMFEYDMEAEKDKKKKAARDRARDVGMRRVK